MILMMMLLLLLLLPTKSENTRAPQLVAGT